MSLPNSPYFTPQRIFIIFDFMDEPLPSPRARFALPAFGSTMPPFKTMLVPTDGIDELEAAPEDEAPGALSGSSTSMPCDTMAAFAWRTSVSTHSGLKRYSAAPCPCNNFWDSKDIEPLGPALGCGTFNHKPISSIALCITGLVPTAGIL